MARKKSGGTMTKKKTSKKKTTKKKTTKKATASKKKTSKKKATASKKKTSKKKTTAKKPSKKKAEAELDEDEALAELEADIEADLAQDFEFSDDSTEEDVQDDDSLMGKSVSFEDGEGAIVIGTVIEHDGDNIRIETEDGEEWAAEVDDVEVVEEKKTKPKPKPKGRKKKAEPEPEEEEEEIELEDDEEEELEDDEEEELEDDEEEEEELEDDDEDVAVEDDPSGFRPVKLIPISSIVIPKTKPREVDKESRKYKITARSIKKNGLRYPIEVDSFSSKKPKLVEGLKRLTIYQDLGREVIPCYEQPCEDEDERLFHGAIANEAREEMHWIDLAKTIARLVAGKRYKKGEVASAFGLSASQVSRMLAALKLPKKAQEHARTDNYSRSVFEELAGEDDKVIKEVVSQMDEGHPVSRNDVRAVRNEFKAEERRKAKEKGKAPKEEKRGGARDKKGPTSFKSRDLPIESTGKNLRIRVHQGYVDLKVRFEWANKTFNKFDPVELLTELLDEVFEDEETAVSSLKALRSEMNSARAELG